MNTSKRSTKISIYALIIMVAAVIAYVMDRIL